VDHAPLLALVDPHNIRENMGCNAPGRNMEGPVKHTAGREGGREGADAVGELHPLPYWQSAAQAMLLQELGFNTSTGPKKHKTVFPDSGVEDGRGYCLRVGHHVQTGGREEPQGKRFRAGPNNDRRRL